MEKLKIGELRNKPTTLLLDGQTTDPFYVFSGSLNTETYIDITSNENWMTVGLSEYDYLFCRNQIIMWTPSYVNKDLEVGWSGLTTTEKEIASKNFAVSETQRDEVFSNSEQQTHWNKFVNISQHTRDVRWKSAKGYISFVLDMPDSIDLGKETRVLTEDYTVYGVESFALDGDPGLFDYLQNTNIYSGSTGFSGKTYWTQNYADNIMTIIRDGIY